MIIKKIKHLSLVSTVFVIGLFFYFLPVKAAGLNFTSADLPGSLIATTTEASNLPWEWTMLSPAYEYSFSSPETYDPAKPLSIKIQYSKANNYLKQIFLWNSKSGSWQPLLTKDDPVKKEVTATTTAVSGRLIVLSNPDTLTVGSASWYKFKGGNFAASPDFKKGSVLRVTNLANGKSVDVTVNDWGPDRIKHPDRVVDLDKTAFQKIASTGSGVIKIKIEAQKIIKPVSSVLAQTGDQPNLTASSAVIMLEDTGRIIWGKKADSVSPLASLSKLVAIKVFLDTKPSLNNVVAYKKQDENYNYKYCKEWESAKISLKEGETVTVEDLIYSALVGSANNAVETLVRVSGLSRNDFIAKMNKTVKNWGATNTSFVEPTGLSKDNVSSPADYAIITKEVFTNPLLKKISTTVRYQFTTKNTKKKHTLVNTNDLVKSSPYSIIGSKTGYLDEAGYCLMTRTKTAKGNLIAVNFGSKSRAANFSDNEQLIRFGLRQLTR